MVSYPETSIDPSKSGTFSIIRYKFSGKCYGQYSSGLVVLYFNFFPILFIFIALQ